AEFYIHYIKENGIDFDINFPEKIIDFIDNQLALKFLKQEFNKLGDILKKTDFTSLRIQMQFSDILDSLNILKEIAEDTAKLEQIPTDKLNAFIKESENNINILQEIKIKLETIANNNQDNQ
ncbi:hypothetical protein IR145_10085, partial [Streptococcus danieliae]|nr:hypothetical protein [Streptococcus danieliae]